MSMFGNQMGGGGQAPNRSRYGGITCANTRDPMLGLGTYRVKIVAATEGRNPGKGRDSYKTTLFVERAEPGSDTEVGTTVTMVNLVNPAGLGELKRFAVAAAGFGPSLREIQSGIDLRAAVQEAESAYNGLDEQSGGFRGAILERTAGNAGTAPSLRGRFVDVIVRRGKDVVTPQTGAGRAKTIAPAGHCTGEDVVSPQTGAATGDYYRIYVWGVVPEEEQKAKG